MNLNKVYYDNEGNAKNILQMVKYEPEWAANRIQVGEQLEQKNADMQKTLDTQFNANQELTGKICELEQEKAELIGIFADLLLEAKCLYAYYPNNFRKSAEEYFKDEIQTIQKYTGEN